MKTRKMSPKKETLAIKPSINKKISPEMIHNRQFKSRKWTNIYLGLIGASAWGILETTILRIIGIVEKIWPQAHNRFMKLMHGLFGSVVTPFESALEVDPSKRTYETRTPIMKLRNDGIFLKKGEMVILPNEEVLQMVLRSNARVTISYCFCRSYAAEKGRPCPMNAPIRTCMTLYFPQPIDMLVQEEPREDMKNHEKVWYDLFKRCDDIGLVHQAIWIPSPNYTYVICNCCPCCCEVLSTRLEMKKEIQYHHKKLAELKEMEQKLLDSLNLKLKTIKSQASVYASENSSKIKKKKKQLKSLRKEIKLHEKGANMELSPITARSSFVAETINPEKCTNCGICAERCYFDARQMHHGVLHYDPDSCYGCGLCISKCPENNIKLLRRKKSRLMGQNSTNPIKHTHPHHKHESNI